MNGLSIDNAAWSSRWRERAVLDKACLSLGLIVAALLLPAWPAAPLVTLGALGLLLVSAGTPAVLIARSLRVPLAFILIGSLSVAITVGGSQGSFLGVSEQSLERAAVVAAHSLAGTSAMLLLAMTTPMSDLLAGLRRLRLPEACVEVAGLTYRMLFILLESAGTIRESQSSRLGYSSAKRSYRSVAMLTAAVLTRSWDRARRLEQGLAGREFTTSMRTLQDPCPSSPTFLASSALAIVGLCVVTLGTQGLLG